MAITRGIDRCTELINVGKTELGSAVSAVGGHISGLGQLRCSMGRMGCYKRDGYHVEKHSRPTPRLAHFIF